MTRYPKLLTWKAKNSGVEEDQAKLLWDYTTFNARLFGLETDYELLNECFDAKLKICSFVNKQVVSALMPRRLCW